MKKTLTALGICTLAVACSGCSTWSKSSPKSTESPWSISKFWKKEYQQPQSIAVIWAPDTLTIPGKPVTRGFGGRIYFYNVKSQAVPVDGDLIVHAYLKHSRHDQSEQVAADKTFAFTAEQLTTHFSPSEIGASYSIWIPWDAADGMRAEVTLIPTFKGTDGTIVQGSPAKVNLPGKVDVANDPTKRGLMQTVSYSQSSLATNPGPDGLPDKPQMRTTTIHVPSNSTISKNKQLQAFTLDTQAASPTPQLPVVSGTGVSMGGGGSSVSSSQPSSMQLNTLQPNTFQPNSFQPNAAQPSSLQPSPSPSNQRSLEAESKGLRLSPMASKMPRAVTIPPPATIPPPVAKSRTLTASPVSPASYSQPE